jgi:hypothetical protein
MSVGSSRGLIETLFWHLPGGTEKYHERPQSGWPVSWRYTDQHPSGACLTLRCFLSAGPYDRVQTDSSYEGLHQHLTATIHPEAV